MGKETPLLDQTD